MPLGKGSSANDAQQQSSFDAHMKELSAEMEVADYATNHKGQICRRESRKKGKIRTIKRKALEKVDAKHAGVEHRLDKKRMRGSKVAFEDEVVMGSMILCDGKKIHTDNVDNASSDDSVVVSRDRSDNDLLKEDEDDDDSSQYENYADELGLDENVVEQEGANEKGKCAHNDQDRNISHDPARAKQPSKGKKHPRQMYRLKNFTSHKMAEKHGDALGAYARGFDQLAVNKLKDVAGSAPIAPQIYSSLGLIYENMFIDRACNQRSTNDIESIETPGEEGNYIKEMRLKLALLKKAYASYHVSALLCKLDYTLWLRAGDAAIAISSLHASCLSYSSGANWEKIELSIHESNESEDESDVWSRNTTREDFIKHHKMEKTKWIEEAKNDYQTADKLLPPGVTVPAKLAQTQLLLGNLSEALTIMTDLKNNSDHSTQKEEDIRLAPRKRTELERSYRVWLLFSDLMLRIGYECMQWNRGIQTNENYMFRRWLRKHSDSFDWRERRLQALCMALEAAAGTESCKKLVAWTHQRAKISEEADHADAETDFVFVQKRDELVARHQSEIDAFDSVTSKMNLSPHSDSFTERRVMRNDIVKRHKSAIVSLVGSYHHKKTTAELSNQGQDCADVEPLPLSASISDVYLIACQLVKLCLEINEYYAGNLVAESVAEYLIKRGLRQERRLKSIDSIRKSQSSTLSNTIRLDKVSYDDVHHNNGEYRDSYLNEEMMSDDEGLGFSDTKALDSWKHGVLPAELRVLYGLCLLSVGNYEYLAEKMLQAVLDLEDDISSKPWTNEYSDDDASWGVINYTMLKPMSKLDALALIVEVVTKTQNQKIWAKRLHSLFKANADHTERLLNVISSCGDESKSMRKDYLKKVFLFTFQVNLHQIEGMSDVSTILEKDWDTESLVNTNVDTITKHVHFLWDYNMFDGTIDVSSVEMLRLYSESVSVKMKCLKRDILNVTSLSSSLKQIVSTICQVSLSMNDKTEDRIGVQSLTESWGTFPISCEWQSSCHSEISKKIHNLCVSCNVESFSGWIRDEFHMGMVKPAGGKTFYKASIQGGAIIGYLGLDIEKEISEQWVLIEALVPNLSYSKFPDHVADVKASQWYKDEMTSLETAFEEEEISKQGEKYAIQILLKFSNLCLLQMNDNDDLTRADLLKISLSILIPISQYYTNQKLWDSSIGRSSVVSSKGVGSWGYKRNDQQKRSQSSSAAHKSTKVSKSPPRTSIKQNGNRNHRDKEKPFKNPITPLLNAVKVSSDLLMQQWKEDNVETREQDDIWGQQCSESSKVTMKALDDNIRKLRKSITISTMQKTSLYIASNLIDLAATKECYNPFVCLGQAALFASQAMKGGNNDDVFKKTLPPQTECKAIDALNILGRADCLRAIHFTEESLFLCSFVARVCCLHRDKKKIRFPWTSQWRAVSIYMYTIAASIDATITSIMEGESKELALAKWSDDVRKEISRARSDAITVKKLRSRSTMSSDVVRKDKVDDEEMEELPYIPDAQETLKENAEAGMPYEVEVPVEIQMESDSNGFKMDHDGLTLPNFPDSQKLNAEEVDMDIVGQNLDKSIGISSLPPLPDEEAVKKNDNLLSLKTSGYDEITHYEV